MDELKGELQPQQTLQSVARLKNGTFKPRLFSQPAIFCIFFAIVSDEVKKVFFPPALFLSLTLNKREILEWFQDVAANHVTGGYV